MLKRFLHKTALHIENIADRAFNRTAKGRYIDTYIGYATPQNIILSGRVLSKLRHATVADGQSKFTNFRQILGMFWADEVRNAAVSCGSIKSVTDEEGYFTLALPNDGRKGWSTENVMIEETRSVTHCPVLRRNQMRVLWLFLILMTLCLRLVLIQF